jgi:hypothetical protein
LSFAFFKVKQDLFAKNQHFWVRTAGIKASGLYVFSYLQAKLQLLEAVFKALHFQFLQQKFYDSK